MAKSLMLTDPSADELLGLAQTGYGTLTTTLCNEIIVGLPQPGGGGGGSGGGAVPSSIPPFSKVMSAPWTWGTPLQIDTAYAAGGPLTPHGIIVIPFTPQLTSNLAKAYVAAYPGNMAGCYRACSISTRAGDFTQMYPWTVYGYDTGINFYVLPTQVRGYASVTAGVNYYLNIASIDENGRWTAPDAGDMRVRVG